MIVQPRFRKTEAMGNADCHFLGYLMNGAEVC